eukprot:NODE_5721_length_391_cov_138.476608_g5023_i0.p1 GENE.NODE_5721_length_391_cov_138.476608_g5023_i0~~NODE_5721_length_391_cov_138.476608_g5023_i0.p1  ORF type:complete len:50 (+),score=5.72 NODE_5721_length_391_cov_138.476608_g5023_i0:197-346(+)
MYQCTMAYDQLGSVLACHFAPLPPSRHLQVDQSPDFRTGPVTHTQEYNQ